MDERIDIHDFDQRLAAAQRAVSTGNPVSKRNSEFIAKFGEHCVSTGLGKARITKYTLHLKGLAERLGKDFDAAGKEDIERVVGGIEREPYSPWTKIDYKVTLKKFYRWLRGGEEYPPEVKWLKTTLKQKDTMLPEDLLTEEEVLRLVEATTNTRDRAFIITLYESGARIGEIGSMRVRDVVFEKGYARLALKGKKGARRVIVIGSVPYLSKWIEEHPLRDNAGAPLWVNMGRKAKQYKAVGYSALVKILRVAAEKCGLKKRIHPYKLRHSRATFLASKLTEAQMDQAFGWQQGSKMPSVYVHLSGRDLDDAILGVYGLKKVKDERSKLVPKACPRCQESNEADAKFCKRCGLAMSYESARDVEKKREIVEALASKLKKNKRFREFQDLLDVLVEETLAEKAE
jgi:site-specific recombinase XerD